MWNLYVVITSTSKDRVLVTFLPTKSDKAEFLVLECGILIGVYIGRDPACSLFAPGGRVPRCTQQREQVLVGVLTVLWVLVKHSASFQLVAATTLQALLEPLSPRTILQLPKGLNCCVKACQTIGTACKANSSEQ